MHTPVQAFTGLECPLQSAMRRTLRRCAYDLVTPEMSSASLIPRAENASWRIAYAGMTEWDAGIVQSLECTSQFQSAIERKCLAQFADRRSRQAAQYPVALNFLVQCRNIALCTLITVMHITRLPYGGTIMFTTI